MTTIAQVIGWKFNDQPGMRTKRGVITQFPGGIPTQAEQDAWTVEYEEHIQAERDKRNLPRGQILTMIQNRQIDEEIERLNKL